MSKRKIINVSIENEVIVIRSSKELSIVISRELTNWEDKTSGDEYVYEVKPLPYNCFVLACLMLKYPKNLIYSESTLEALKHNARETVRPKAYIQSVGHIGINVPSIPFYNRLMNIIGAKRVKMAFYTVPFSRLYEAYRILKSQTHYFLPVIRIEKDLEDFVTEKLSFERTMSSLFKIRLMDLHSVKYGWKIDHDGFAKLKYNTAVDLLLRRPKRYVDRTDTTSSENAPYRQNVYIRGIVQSARATFNNRLNIKLTEKLSGDELDFTFFSGGYLANTYSHGDEIVVQGSKIGKNKFNGGSIYSAEEVAAIPIAPVYRQSPKSKITTKVLTNCTEELFLRFDGGDLAPYFSDDLNIWKSLYDLHFPKSLDDYHKTINKLAYLELVYLQLSFIHKRATEKKHSGLPKINKNTPVLKSAIQALPYSLTKGQKVALTNIFKKLASDEAEDILLSGDVGSGKTTVAQAACLYNYESGYQSVLVGPTEILAQQLYSTFEKFLAPLKDRPNIAYLSGNTKAKERKKVLAGVKDGSIDILVGTHSVFNIEYKNLGLLVIDEQQKFGTRHKEALLHTRSDGRVPDVIAQTATPIPRSTALAFYGDVDLITLSEKPGGRKENITRWIKQSVNKFLHDERSETWKHIFSEIDAGHQIFIVTPAVDESAKSASVKEVYKILESKYSSKIAIDFVHGQLAKDTQNKKIEKFRVGKTQVLIASTVVEVGVDIPNSTIMLVLDAHKFGASSLHQIRGRVGRSDAQGYCYLVSDSETPNSQTRLESLVNSNDGFEIALVDLSTRKEGDLLGTRQSGESSLMFCDLADHSKFIEKAAAEATRIYESQYKEMSLLDADIFLRKGGDEQC